MINGLISARGSMFKQKISTKKGKLGGFAAALCETGFSKKETKMRILA